MYSVTNIHISNLFFIRYASYCIISLRISLLRLFSKFFLIISVNAIFSSYYYKYYYKYRKFNNSVKMFRSIKTHISLSKSNGSMRDRWMEEFADHF